MHRGNASTVHPTRKGSRMDNPRILCIGDSHTAGFPGYDPMMGGNPESSYQFWLKKELLETRPDSKYDFINEGVCGDTSRGIVYRLTQALDSTHYDLVILAGGTNDLGMTSEKQILKNLRRVTRYAGNEKPLLLHQVFHP